jgi:hypothetical protein
MKRRVVTFNSFVLTFSIAKTSCSPLLHHERHEMKANDFYTSE